MANSPDHTLPDTVAAVTKKLAVLHIELSVHVIDSVVRQAAWELAGSPRPRHEFTRLLRRRAGARLLAMTGTFTPVQRQSSPF